MHYAMDQQKAQLMDLKAKLCSINQDIKNEEVYLQKAQSDVTRFKQEVVRRSKHVTQHKESLKCLQQDRDRIQQRLDNIIVPVITVDYNSNESLREAAKELSGLAREALRHYFLELDPESQLTDYLKVADKCRIYALINRPLFAGFSFSCPHREQYLFFKVQDNNYLCKLYFDNFNLIFAVRNPDSTYNPKVIAKLQ